MTYHLSTIHPLQMDGRTNRRTTDGRQLVQIAQRLLKYGRLKQHSSFIKPFHSHFKD